MTDTLNKPRIKLSDLQRSELTNTFIENLAKEVRVPIEAYKEATEKYERIKSFLETKSRYVSQHAPDLFVQGSFRIGTAIKPINAEDDYDVDISCVLSLNTNQTMQHELKQNLLGDLEDYVRSTNMPKPEEKTRCWRLNYTGQGSFHIDIVPAINEHGNEHSPIPSIFSHDVKITDIDDENYKKHTTNWPKSNPKGYAEWFDEKNLHAFNIRKKDLAVKLSRAEDDIPPYEVQTPLQAAIQILKYHRDVYFADKDELDYKPASIIITTLAAEHYNNETSTTEALYAIVDRITQHEFDSVENPVGSDLFTEKWVKDTAYKDKFFNWLRSLNKLLEDISGISNESNLFSEINPHLSSSTSNALQVNIISNRNSSFWQDLIKPSHREPIKYKHSGDLINCSLSASYRKGF